MKKHQLSTLIKHFETKLLRAKTPTEINEVEKCLQPIYYELNRRPKLETTLQQSWTNEISFKEGFNYFFTK
jgi:hypothetical protein